MKIAVLSDVHGNLQALETAAAEIHAWGADRVWFLGDVVAFGPDPRECLTRLLDDLEPEICIEGNTDRYLREKPWATPGSGSPSPLTLALRHAHDALQPAERDALGSFRRDVIAEVEGVSFHLCHGAPGDDEQRLAPDMDPGEVVAALGPAKAKVVLCGHTHVPWLESFPEARVMNDGSVGYPFDGDVRGSWLALDVLGREVTPRLHRFEFDREETIQRLESFGPLTAVLVRRLRTGRP